MPSPAGSSAFRIVRTDAPPVVARVAMDAAPPVARPVVLVHGLIVSGDYLMPLAEQLAPHFPTYVPDLPGTGISAADGAPPDLASLAGALERWMDAVGLDRPAVVGNSFGCQIAAELAVRAPGRVDRLVLLSPTLDPRLRSPPHAIVAWARAMLVEPPSFALVGARDLARIGLGRGARMFRALYEDAIEERMPSIRAPTLVVRGTRDPLVSGEWAERLAKAAPRGAYVELDGATHVMNYAQPEATARGILPFLSGPA